MVLGEHALKEFATCYPMAYGIWHITYGRQGSGASIGNGIIPGVEAGKQGVRGY